MFTGLISLLKTKAQQLVNGLRLQKKKKKKHAKGITENWF